MSGISQTKQIITGRHSPWAALLLTIIYTYWDIVDIVLISPDDQQSLVGAHFFLKETVVR